MKSVTEDFFEYYAHSHSMPRNEFQERFCSNVDGLGWVLDFQKDGIFGMLYSVLNDCTPNTFDKHDETWEAYEDRKTPYKKRVHAFRQDTRQYVTEKFASWFDEDISEHDAMGKVIGKFGWALLFLQAQRNNPNHPILNQKWTRPRQKISLLLRKFLVWGKAKGGAAARMKLSSAFARVKQ